MYFFGNFWYSVTFLSHQPSCIYHHQIVTIIYCLQKSTETRSLYRISATLYQVYTVCQFEHMKEDVSEPSEKRSLGQKETCAKNDQLLEAIEELLDQPGPEHCLFLSWRIKAVLLDITGRDRSSLHSRLLPASGCRDGSPSGLGFTWAGPVRI